MDSLLYFLLAACVVGVVYALARGVIGMANGKDVSGRQSNKYMGMRVIFQGAAVLIIVLIAYLAGQMG